MFDDMYAKDYGVGLRFHNVYGKNSRKDTLLGICLKNGEITLYNNGLNYRHFTYVEDVCECVERAMNLPDGLYNVANPIENSVAEFVDEVKKYKPLEVVKTQEVREADKERQIVDETHENINKTPTNIREGLKRVFN
jgi:nucleoside-diphosphate-sugar epimerase